AALRLISTSLTILGGFPRIWNSQFSESCRNVSPTSIGTQTVKLPLSALLAIARLFPLRCVTQAKAYRAHGWRKYGREGPAWVSLEFASVCISSVEKWTSNRQIQGHELWHAYQWRRSPSPQRKHLFERRCSRH